VSHWVAVIVTLRVPVREKVGRCLDFSRTWGVRQQAPSQLPFVAL
jgi:hypothetical protein